MRGMFSLVALLVTVAIIAWAWSSYTGTVVKEGQAARDRANSIAGNAPDGTPAISTITIEPKEQGGHLRSLLVKSVVPGGIMEQYYGVKAGDEIIQIGDYPPVKEQDSGLATAEMQEAYMRKNQLLVLRGGQQITLPAPAGSAQSGDSSAAELQRSLQKIPTH